VFNLNLINHLKSRSGFDPILIQVVKTWRIIHTQNTHIILHHRRPLAPPCSVSDHRTRARSTPSFIIGDRSITAFSRHRRERRRSVRSPIDSTPVAVIRRARATVGCTRRRVGSHALHRSPPHTTTSLSGLRRRLRSYRRPRTRPRGGVLFRSSPPCSVVALGCREPPCLVVSGFVIRFSLIRFVFAPFVTCSGF
jgi:hypothetical protein